MKIENKCECGTTHNDHSTIVEALKDFYNPCDKCGAENELKFVQFTSKKGDK